MTDNMTDSAKRKEQDRQDAIRHMLSGCSEDQRAIALRQIAADDERRWSTERWSR